MGVEQLPIASIVVDHGNLRSSFGERKLDELCDSVEEVGILHPILVHEMGNGYRLIAGERRLRASMQIGRETIPGIVLSGDKSVRQIQLVENLQREDLNPLDRASAVQAFMEEESLTKTDAAKKLGVPRTTLNDWLDILDVGDRYQNAVINNYYGGSSPLTTSHISLAKRFAAKWSIQGAFEAILEAVLQYGLTRSETKKVIRLMEASPDVPLEKAVRKVRIIPRDGVGNDGEEELWDVDQLVAFLSRSGDYLVKSKLHDLAELDEEKRRELLRQSKALSKLLQEVMEVMEGSEPKWNIS